MENSQSIVLKIVAPNKTQLKGTLAAIESLTPIFFESQIKYNDKDSGLHCYLTVPINWFNNKNCAEPNSQEQPCTDANPVVNRLTEAV